MQARSTSLHQIIVIVAHGLREAFNYLQQCSWPYAILDPPLFMISQQAHNLRQVLYLLICLSDSATQWPFPCVCVFIKYIASIKQAYDGKAGGL